jgi:hypothetical protein
MPSKLGKGRPKTKKAILTPEQVGAPLKAAVEGCSPSALAGQMSRLRKREFLAHRDPAKG